MNRKQTDRKRFQSKTTKKCTGFIFSFVLRQAAIRSKERKMLSKAGFIQSMQVSLVPIIPVLSTVLTFTVHTLLGYPLDASKVRMFDF